MTSVVDTVALKMHLPNAAALQMRLNSEFPTLSPIRLHLSLGDEGDACYQRDARMPMLLASAFVMHNRSFQPDSVHYKCTYQMQPHYKCG